MSKRQVVSFYNSKVRFSWVWYLNKRLVRFLNALVYLMFFCSIVLGFLAISTLVYVAVEKHYLNIGINVLEWIEDKFTFIMYFEGVLAVSILGKLVHD